MYYEKGTFVTIPNRQKLAVLSAPAQALFVWICIYADEDGLCFPSRSTLAKNLQCSIRSVDCYLEELIKAEFITKQQRIKNNEKKSNLYQIMLVSGGSATVAPGGSANSAPPSANSAPGGSANSAHRTKTISLSKTKELTTSDFSVFWNLYPKKIAKGSAEKAWLKLKPDIAIVTKSLEAQKQCDQWVRDNGKYIPHPTTWLNGKRWEDEVEEKQITKTIIL